MRKIKCLTCGTIKTFPTQGRYIDGSWAEDHTLSKKVWGKWVCSWSCFAKLKKDPEKNKKKFRKRQIILKNGQMFEVYARCRYAYIGFINREVEVVFEDDPRFPENPNKGCGYDLEGNKIIFFEPYCNEVISLPVVNNVDIVDPITQRILVSVMPIQDGWLVFDTQKKESRVFSRYWFAHRFAYDYALNKFFNTLGGRK